MWLPGGAPKQRQPAHQGFVPFGPLVLKRTPLKIPTVIPDRARTVLRRSEPSSRTLLTGEQPDPWELLHPQDRMSRHRNLVKNWRMPSWFLRRSDYIFIRQLAESACYGIVIENFPSDSLESSRYGGCTGWCVLPSVLSSNPAIFFSIAPRLVWTPPILAEFFWSRITSGAPQCLI